MNRWTKEAEKRLKEMKKLHKKGLTYEEIGKKYKLSRQRVHQILTGYNSPQWYKR